MNELAAPFIGETSLAPRGRGRGVSVVLGHSLLRPLTKDDIYAIATQPLQQMDMAAMSKLRSSHHSVARLVAEGVPNAEIALITGFTTQRVYQLKLDPSFCELVEYYSAQLDQVFINVHERLAAFSLDVLETLQDRLEEAPEKFTNKELMALLDSTMDRSGHGPRTTQVHELGGLTLSSILDQVKVEIRNKQSGRITSLDPQAKAQEGGSSAPPGGGLVLEARPNTPSPAAEGIESSGAGV